MAANPKRWSATVPAAVVLLLAACAGIDVGRSRNDSIPLGASPTYAWTPAASALGGLPEPDPGLDEKIRRAIEIELDSRGFRRDAPEAADLLTEYRLDFQPGERQVTQQAPAQQGPVGTRSSLSPGAGFGPPPVVTSGTAPTLGGSLEIVLRHRRSGQVFYRAAGRQEDVKGEAFDAKIQRVVKELLGGL